MVDLNYEDFRGPDSFCYKVRDINDFTVTVDFPTVSEWDDRVKSAVLDRLHDAMINLIDTARFYSAHHLESTKRSDSVSIQFNDDVYDFIIQCFSDHMIIRKRGVSMSRFHEWYGPAAQSFGRVVETITDALSTTLDRNIVITRANFNFRFILYGFIDAETGTSIKNYEMLRRLITRMPDATGKIHDVEDTVPDVSRADYNVFLWDDSKGPDRRLLGFSAEAPANNLYTGLWLSFRYGSETYKDPLSGERHKSDPSLVLDEYERIYEFLWDRFIGGFIRSVLGEKVQFSSTTTYIP